MNIYKIEMMCSMDEDEGYIETTNLMANNGDEAVEHFRKELLDTPYPYPAEGEEPAGVMRIIKAELHSLTHICSGVSMASSSRFTP